MLSDTVIPEARATLHNREICFNFIDKILSISLLEETYKFICATTINRCISDMIDMFGKSCKEKIHLFWKCLPRPFHSFIFFAQCDFFNIVINKILITMLTLLAYFLDKFWEFAFSCIAYLRWSSVVTQLFLWFNYLMMRVHLQQLMNNDNNKLKNCIDLNITIDNDQLIHSMVISNNLENISLTNTFSLVLQDLGSY